MKPQPKNKHYSKIQNLIGALQQCGYDVSVDWDAEWYCSDSKIHHGIEVEIDVDDGDGNPYSFIFNGKGKRIDSCLEGEQMRYFEWH